MRKLIFGIITSVALHAAPVENGAAPKIIQKGFLIPCRSWIDFRLGYEGDFVSNGKMEQVDRYKQWTNSATFTLNFLNRLDVYGIFGSSETKTHWRSNEAGIITRVQLETNQDFLWAVGSRVILYEWFNTSLGFGGRYSYCDYTLQNLTADGIDQPVDGSHLFWKQWQVNLDLSYQIRYFTPYIGVKYSDAKADLTQVVWRNQFETYNPVGLYLGCTISNGCYFMFNIEGRLIDEEAVTVSADFRF